jgi:hypothetical protein
MGWLYKTWRFLLALILPGFILYIIWKNYQIKHNARYTIGVTQRRVLTAKSGFEIDYIFYVNGHQHEGSGYDVKKYNIQYPGSRYIVKYSYRFPSQSEILWNLPIPDSIKNVPPDGWIEIPVWKIGSK